MPSLSEPEIQAAAGKYFPLAVSIAKSWQRQLPPGVRQEQDLIGVASIRLVECLRRYDPARGAALSQWIRRQIEGAILDYLRALDPLPQQTRADVKRLTSAEDALSRRWQRIPTDRELAQHLGVSLHEVHHLKQSATTTLISLDGAELSPDAMPQAPGRAEMDTALAQYWERLAQPEKVAVSLHLDRARLEDIARVLEVSRATAGRLLDTALRKLHESLAPEDHDGG